MRSRSWTKEQLTEAVEESNSFRQVLRRLKLKPSGGNYLQLKHYIKELGLDIAHFKGQGWNRGLVEMGIARIPLEQMLVKNSSLDSSDLKRRLLKAKLKPDRCEECGWSKRAADGTLPLVLHHRNADERDNRLENLRILCPNCYSLVVHSHSRHKKT